MSGGELYSQEIRNRERRRRRWAPFWSLLSVLLHLGIPAAIIYLTPLKEIVIEERPKPMKSAAEDLSPERLREIGETLSEVRINELLQQLQEMQTVLHNMDLVKEQLAKDYDAFAAKSAEDARSLLEQLVAETEQAQQKTVAAQDAVKAEVAELVRVETQADLRQQETKLELQAKLDKLGEELVERTNTAQANAVNALDKLLVKAEFAGFEQTAQAAEKFKAAQIEAAKLQDGAQNAAIEIARELTQIADNAKWIAEHERVIAENEQKQAEAKRIKAEKAAFLEAKAAEKQAFEAAQAKLREEKKWKEVKALQQEFAPVQKELNEAKKAMETAERRIAETERNLKWRRERVQPDYEKREKLERSREARATAQQVADLERSEQLQRELNARIAILKEVLAKDSSKLEPVAQAEQRQEHELVSRELAALKMSEAHALARELESAVADSFKEVKALETAMAKKMSYEAASKLTDVAKPERKQADPQLLEAKVATKAELDRQKAAQVEVVRDAKEMAENTRQMMAQAMELVAPPSASSSLPASREERVRWLEEQDFANRADAEAMEARLAELSASAEYQVELAEAAAESTAEKAKDIAELMKSEAELQAEAMRAELQGQDGAVEQRGAEGKSTGANPGPPELKAGDLSLVPGNVMAVKDDAGAGIPAKWMYVNSWHVIGPFPNPNRANLRVKFQPESRVDLDATYVGKDGRILRWEYQQAKSCKPPQPWMADWHAEVVPEHSEEYVIFYAYAEVFFDAPCDRWIAIGSDDRSDVWINDIPVWGSSNRLKAWKLAEDFRRVHFRKGRNRILVRIENGHWNFGWSLCISTTDEKSDF